MIEVKYYYLKRRSETPMVAYAYFHNVDKAIRFMYKCKSSSRMFYSGEFSCDDSWTTQEIERRFR